MFTCLRCLYIIGNTPKCYNVPEGQHGLQTMPDWAGFATLCPFFYISLLASFMHVPIVSDIKVTFDVVYNVIVLETLMNLMPRKRWTIDNSLVFSRLL